MISRASSIILWIFDPVTLRRAYHKSIFPDFSIRGFREYAAYGLIVIATWLGLRALLLDELRRRLPPDVPSPAAAIFTAPHLHARLNRIFDLPSVRVSTGRRPTVNVLVPAFDFNSISAGFFGVFNVALFLRREGHHVRLVMFDEFHFDPRAFRDRLQGYPGMERLPDELEIEYIGNRTAPLEVSPDDTCVATVWYSAYLAEKVMKLLGGRPFLYLIQDYETHFFPGGSLFALADATYDMNYVALFSTESLKAYFEKHDVGGIVARSTPRVHFDNACSSNLLPRDEFMALNASKSLRSLVFYSRPVVDRNMFELTALTLHEAFASGLFDADAWECIGMGLGDGVVDLGNGRVSRLLPRMSLKDYHRAVAGFDICLSLMASPHPSLVPMDLAGSGAIVVTNTFRTKTAAYLSGLSGNIIAAEPTPAALLEALAVAKERCFDLDARFANAEAMTYPTRWVDSLTKRHSVFLREHLFVR